MKKMLKMMMLLVCLMMLGGCSVEMSEQKDPFDDLENYMFCVAEEKAIKNDNTVLYRIEYEYDEAGNEVSRKAYGADGMEKKELLNYAYDKHDILKEYWSVEPDTEDRPTGYWKTYEDYEFVYDSFGRLVTWWFYDDNEYGVSKITYTYDAIRIQ